jgi:citrate lyase subunit beta/citryl-CoA lyase
VRVLLSEPAGVPLYVRVNARDTAWHEEDVAGVASRQLRGLVLPKCESAGDVVECSRLLAAVERERGLPEGGLELMALLETAAGVLHAEEIVGADRRLARLAFGAYDYARDLNLQLSASGDELLVARTMVTLAARVARIQPVDTVFADLGDHDGLLAEARRARALGFTGKMCIHPSQLEAVHAVFSPSAEQVALAERVVQAFEAAEAAGRAAIAVDGKLVDYPIAEQQRRLLERAASLGLAPSRAR